MATVARRSIDMHDHRSPSANPRPSVDSRHSFSSQTSQSSQKRSLGRGGAGNFGIAAPFDQDLSTPALKNGANVTTGRGGAGNIAHGLSAEARRELQDVDGLPPRRRESFHMGLGGAGNVRRSGSAERRVGQEERERYLDQIRAEDQLNVQARKNERGLADMAKDKLFHRKRAS